MENIGDSTLFWFGSWTEFRADGVRVAEWEKDRLGSLAMDPALTSADHCVISCPINMQVTSPHLTPPHLTPPHSTSPHLTSPHLI
jgi:hypothetical protein